MNNIIFCLILIIASPCLAKTQQAIFAGGCFWCLEADFDKLNGVTQTVSGYDGGQIESPSYQLVSSGKTHYIEVVRVTYEPTIISYQELVNYFWRHIDPLDNTGQFCDKGFQYRSAIFYLNERQKTIAEQSKQHLSTVLGPVVTLIKPSTHFAAAENYHQNYYNKNPLSYKYYRYRCGRDKRVKEVWQHVKSQY